MLNRTISLGTDVATFLLYHPDDLTHRSDAPTGWYGHDFAYRQEVQAGHMVAFGTGADGGYLLRLTDGPLTDAEQAAERARLAFPLRVEHGRIFLDNSDGLPGEGHMIDPAHHPEQWIDLPNGAYRVTVVEIDWSGDESLPSYVIQFTPTDNLSAIQPPDRLTHTSDLNRPPRPAAPPRPSPEEQPLDDHYPLIPVEGTFVAPSAIGTVYLPRAISKALFAKRAVVRPTADAPLGTLVQVVGTRMETKDEYRVTLSGQRFVQVLSQSPGDPYPTACVEAFERKQESPSPDQVAALQAAYRTYAQTEPAWAERESSPVWTMDRIEAGDVGWAEIMHRATDHLGFDGSEQLALAQRSDAEQVDVMTRRLAAVERP